jgi:hypothetical protein
MLFSCFLAICSVDVRHYAEQEGRKHSMTEWEYISIDLSNLPFRTAALDLLNDAGREGWELVGITDNGLAYLKRQIDGSKQKSVRKRERAEVKRSAVV